MATSRPGPTELALLLNENARKVTNRWKITMARLLPSIQLYSSRSLDEASQHIRTALDQGYQRIVCGGGDGTIVHVLTTIRDYLDEQNTRMQELGNGIRDHLDGMSWPSIGLVKLGTGNGWAGEMGSIRPLEDLRRLLEERHMPTRRFHLIESEDRLFHFSGLGYDANILYDYLQLKKRFSRGPLALWFKSLGGYLTTIMLKTVPRQLLNRERPQVRVTVGDGQVYSVSRSRGSVPLDVGPGDTIYEGPLNIIGASTTTHYGFGLKAFPFAREKQGFFNFRIVKSNVLELIRHPVAIWRGVYETPTFIDFLARDIKLEFDRPMPFHVGGDLQGLRRNIHYRISDFSIDVFDFGS